MNKSDHFWLSPFNQEAEVVSQLSDMKKEILVYDTTLRDGEQSTGVTFTTDEKIEIAQALADAGVDRIEGGFASSTPQDKDAITKIKAAVKGADIWGFGRCNPNDVKDCLETGVQFMVLEIGTSPQKMKAWNLSEETVLKRMRDAVSFAKKEGVYVAFFAVDATRAEKRFLETIYKTAVNDCGADEIVVVDTLGVATPEAMYWLVKQARNWVSVPVAVHCHNDFGLGTACTIASLKAGASSVHVTVNGLGEKTGNCDLAELAIALYGLYDIKMNIKMDKLFPLSKLVEKASGMKVAAQRPVVGDLAFARETGLAIAQVLEYPPSVEGYDPAVVGRERSILLGKKSGRKSIEYALEQIGDAVGEDKMDALLSRVKSLGITKKGIVSLDEFKTLVREFK